MQVCIASSAEQAEDARACALISGTRSVTYAELAAMVELATRTLCGMGVEPGSRIAMRLPSGIETVAVLLAALGAGAAFAPISPGEPPRRLKRFLEKCRPNLLVTTQAELDLIEGVRVVECSQLFRPRAPALAERAAPVGRSDDPAYIIFTSGTSGEPKSVVIEHGGIVNAVMWKIREYALSPKCRVLPLFGYEFDGFVLNVFALLGAGATVVLLDDDDRRNPARIAACIDSQAVTHVVTGPLLHEATLDHVIEGKLGSLQVVPRRSSADPQTIIRSKRLFPREAVERIRPD